MANPFAAAAAAAAGMGTLQPPAMAAAMAAERGNLSPLFENDLMLAAPGSLQMSCRQGRLGVVKALTEGGVCSPHARDATGMTPFFVACGAGELGVAQYLYQVHKVDVSAPKTEVPNNPSKNDLATPLLIACRHGHADVVRWLISIGTDVNTKKKRGASPLFIAAQVGRVGIVELLAQSGADIDAATEYGATPLYIAAQNGHEHIVSLLAQRGANINATREFGITPLYISCQNGHTGVVRRLIEGGANVHLCRQGGVTPLYIAVQNGHHETAKYLLEHTDIDPNATTDTGITALMISCQGGFTKCVECLLEYGHVDVDKTGVALSAFEIACINQHFQIARLLAAYGCSRILNSYAFVSHQLADWINRRVQWTRLQFAVEARLPALVLRMLEQGADPFDVPDDSPSLLQLAKEPTEMPPESDEAAVPACPQTLAVVRRAVAAWSPSIHHLYGPCFRQAVFATLCLEQRMRDQHASIGLPMLPTEVWMHILSFLQRSDFPNDTVQHHHSLAATVPADLVDFAVDLDAAD